MQLAMVPVVDSLGNSFSKCAAVQCSVIFKMLVDTGTVYCFKENLPQLCAKNCHLSGSVLKFDGHSCHGSVNVQASKRQQRE